MNLDVIISFIGTLEGASAVDKKVVQNLQSNKYNF
jgi:hypothetical protein